MFTFTKNELTDKLQTQFSAKLINVSTNILKNVNGTEYRLANIEFTDAEGKVQRISAMIYESNFKQGVKNGEYYLTTATYDEEKGVLVTVSHLIGNGIRATADMFNFKDAKIEETTTATTQATPKKSPELAKQ